MEIKKRYVILSVFLIAVIISLLYVKIPYFSGEWFAAIFFIIVTTFALYKYSYFQKKDAVTVMAAFIIISQASTFYYDPAVNIARNAGPILNDNWFNALTWIRDNTAECSTIATYWDPGHFIRAIAKRAVIFDGGSQNADLKLPTDEPDHVDILQYENNIHRIIKYENGERITARIQDVAASMLTSNESLAVEILKDYKKEGCDEMYFLATSDLIGKSTWWSYFGTWSPENEGDKGKRYVYSLVQLSQAKPVPQQNAITYIYPLSQNQAIVLYEINDTMTPYLQQGTQFLKFEKIFYFTQDGRAVVSQSNDPQINGMLWLDPSKSIIVIIPPELENALFTKMFFYNGAGLEKFELVNSWNGEVKLFRIKLEDVV